MEKVLTYLQEIFGSASKVHVEQQILDAGPDTSFVGTVHESLPFGCINPEILWDFLLPSRNDIFHELDERLPGSSLDEGFVQRSHDGIVVRLGHDLRSNLNIIEIDKLLIATLLEFAEHLPLL